MFDVLVYLYETYYRPDVCPEPAALAKSLSDIGFRESEIKDALAWLTDLTLTTHVFDLPLPHPDVPATGPQRIYAEQEYIVLGMDGIGFIQSLELAGVLAPLQREIVIERALAVDDSPLSLEQLRIIVLMLLWSQGEEPDAITLDTLFPEDDPEAPLLH